MFSSSGVSSDSEVAHCTTWLRLVAVSVLCFFEWLSTESPEDLARRRVRNELSEYAKATRAVILMQRQYPAPSKLLDADQSTGSWLSAELSTSGLGLDFLVTAGIYHQVGRDAWGQAYRIDPSRSVVLSLGPDPSDPSDDIEVSYLEGCRGLDEVLVDTVAPVLTEVGPYGTIAEVRPRIFARFYDHFGGQMDLQSIRLTVDDREAGAPLMVDAQSVEWQSAVPLTCGAHVATIEASDAEGNRVRRTWSFVVSQAD